MEFISFQEDGVHLRASHEDLRGLHQVASISVNTLEKPETYARVSANDMQALSNRLQEILRSGSDVAVLSEADFKTASKVLSAHSALATLPEQAFGLTSGQFNKIRKAIFAIDHEAFPVEVRDLDDI